MKVAILNYCGTVGKTTLAAHMLAPRMANAPIYAIETINESADKLGLDIEKIKGDNFRALFKKLIIEENAIIDVGASNIEDFMTGIIKYNDAHLEIDYFLIPVTPGNKEMRESIAMIEHLAENGVTPEKIKVIFNRVENPVTEDFAPLFKFHKAKGLFTLAEKAAILETDLFDLLSSQGSTIQAVLDDPTDFKAAALEARRAGDDKAAMRAADRAATKALARTMIKNLDLAYCSLFPQAA